MPVRFAKSDHRVFFRSKAVSLATKYIRIMLLLVKNSALGTTSLGQFRDNLCAFPYFQPNMLQAVQRVKERRPFSRNEAVLYGGSDRGRSLSRVRPRLNSVKMAVMMLAEVAIFLRF
jgi:hypothetical protein